MFLFDSLAKLNANAVIFQVRPAADALYASKLEPWSEVLSERGEASPDPYTIRSSLRSRCPCTRSRVSRVVQPVSRATSPSISPMAENHVAAAAGSREGLREALWLDPTRRTSRRTPSAVILDVVRRYDIDGIHLDDYFYPYPKEDGAGKVVDFPDDDIATYSPTVVSSDVTTGVGRREPVRERIHGEMKAVKPCVQVGISPFGIWRPGRPAHCRDLTSTRCSRPTRALVPSRLGRLSHTAALLADHPEEQSYPRVARVVGGAERGWEASLARPRGVPRGRGRERLAGRGDRRADPPHPRAARRHGAHPLSRAGAARKPRGNRDGAEEGRLAPAERQER